jgi:hypothetical protein
MFFIERNNIEDFQNRFVIAMFLDACNGVVKFKKYIGKFHFIGEITPASDMELSLNTHYGTGKIPSGDQDIYLFDVPDIVNGVEDTGVVFKYRGRWSKRNFAFFTMPDEFIKAYKEYSNNPYVYISDKFGPSGWENKYPNLLVSDQKCIEKILTHYNYNDGFYKYKPDPDFDDALYSQFRTDPNSASTSKYRFFVEALKGTLAFTKPEKLNDPFDCDCEIPENRALPKLFSMAKDKTLYFKNSISSMPDMNIDNWWDSLDSKDQDHIIDLLNKYTEEKDTAKQKELLPDIEIALKDLYYNAKEKKPLNREQLELFLAKLFEIKKNLKNMKNDFRILSLTNIPTDILMWGYYADSSKGICLNHKVDDLYRGIEKSSDVSTSGASICIYGHIDYETKKPLYNDASQKWYFSDVMSFVVKCVFTKFKNWEHENEIRYVLMGGNVRDKEVICINSKTNKCYLGVYSDQTRLYDALESDEIMSSCGLDRSKGNLIQLEKHKTDYIIVDPTKSASITTT